MPPSGWRRWTAPALVVVVVLTVAALGWTWRHPRAFGEGGGWSLEYKQLAEGTPFYVGVTFPQGGTTDSVTIHDVRANLTDQSGRLDVAALVCSLRPAENSAVGAGNEATARKTCTSLVPAEGATLRLGRERSQQQQLVLAVTARGPANVVIDGIDVTYSSGWQRGPSASAARWSSRRRTAENGDPRARSGSRGRVR